MRAALCTVTLGVCLGVSGCRFQPDEGERISCMQDEQCPGDSWCGGVARFEEARCFEEAEGLSMFEADGICSFLYCIDNYDGEVCGEEGLRCGDQEVCVFIKGYTPSSEPYYRHHCARRPLIDAAEPCYGLDNPHPPGHEPPNCDENNQACLLVFEKFRYEEDPPFRCVNWSLLDNL